jgi:hypothetical protein
VTCAYCSAPAVTYSLGYLACRHCADLPNDDPDLRERIDAAMRDWEYMQSASGQSGQVAAGSQNANAPIDRQVD